MNRKHFLSTFFATGTALSVKVMKGEPEKEELEKPDQPSIIPRYLFRGDTIGVTCPAGYITLEEIQPAITQMESWGMKIRIGDTVGKRDFSFGGTDEERRKDLQNMMDDSGIQAIMCARGGYGLTRIIDQLNFTRFKEKPKWIIGFSDITGLHLHLDRHWQIASLHSKMCNSFPEVWEFSEPVIQESIQSIRQALTGVKMIYSAIPNDKNRLGVAEGIVTGGNLSMIQNLMGTKSELKSDGKILFLEEVGEYLYSLDRMMMNLKRAGKLDKLNALVLGGFNRIRPDDPGEEFGRTIYDIVWEKVKEYNYPVCFDFPFGHQKNNYALKCGVKHVLTARKDMVELKEI
jgi:muramoyltetrapeptide carboxypeptidase